jgi:hypothetical protein
MLTSCIITAALLFEEYIQLRITVLHQLAIIDLRGYGSQKTMPAIEIVQLKRLENPELVLLFDAHVL